MLKVEKSIFIKKTPAEVFTFITTEGNYTKWQPGVTQVIEGGPRNTVGSHFTEVRKFMGRELRTTKAMAPGGLVNVPVTPLTARLSSVPFRVPLYLISV